MDMKEYYWATGMYEGEGSAGVIRPKASKNDKRYTQLVVTVTSTDIDVLDRFKATFGGLGTIHSTGKRPNQTKQCYRWRSTCRSARQVLMTMLPMLGERRLQQATSVLALDIAA